MKKQNKRNKLARITLALLLILSMIGNTLILPAVAQENLAPTDETILPETPLDGTSDATGAATLPEPIQLTAADIPEFISAAALEERGAVERMRAEETNMSSVIFRNADGTRTMYMYGLPVKYTAMDGTVRDKSTNLVSVSTASVLLDDQPVAQTMAQMSTTQRAALQEELGILDAERAATTLHMLSTALTTRGKSLSDMAYTTLDNDVYALFPTNLTQGMTLVFGEHSVRMTPATGMTMTTGGNVTKTTTASLADSDITERLLYPNVFGPGTAVQYTPTLTGVKEEILLSRNVGKNSFAFLLETGGLILTETNGQFTLVAPETEQTVGTLGEIIVFDSAGQIVRGNMTAQTIKDGQIYGITISVDQEFLASATYPVSIDPSTRVYQYMLDSADNLDIAIEDISLYNDSSCAGYTFVEWHQIGDVFDTNCRGQAVFRFPFLYDPNGDAKYYSLTSSDISSFVLQLKSTGNTTATNVLRASPYVPIWSDENNDGIYEQKVFSSQYYWYSYISDWDAEVNNVPSNATFSIDLTGFAKKWKDMQHGIITDPGDGLPETGVLLWNFEDEGNVWLESAGYSADLCVIMEYSNAGEGGDFYMNNRATKKFLTAFDDDEQPSLLLYSGLVGEMDPYITWNVEYIGNGNFYLHPNGRDDLYLDMYGNFRTAETFQAKWTRSIPDGGGVVWTAYNGNVLAVNSNGNVVIGAPSQFSAEQMAWRMVRTDSYIELNPNQVSSNVIWVAPEEHVNIFNNLSNSHFSQADDFTYTINSSAVTHSDGVIVGVVPNAIAVVVLYHKPTGQSMSVSICVAPLKEGNYFFQSGVPLSTPNMFMQIDDLYAPDYNTNMASLELRSLNGEEHQEWILTRVYNDYYSVISAKSGKAVAVRSTYVDSGMGVLAQETYNSLDRQLWKFEETTNGTYVVRPKSAESYSTDWCMATTSSTSEGKSVIQSAYWADNDLTDEWILAYIETSSDIEHEGQQRSTWCWVTAARIFAKHYYPEVTRTQSEAVAFVRGSITDGGGFEDDQKTAIEYYIGNIDDAVLNLQYAKSDSPSTKKIYSEEILRRFLDDGHVIIVSRGEYVGSNRQGGHATVITGYVSITVGGVTQYRYIIYDPWPFPEPSPWNTQQTTTGQIYLRSYQWICNSNKTLTNYETSDNRIWDGYVTVLTDYSGSSIDPDW